MEKNFNEKKDLSNDEKKKKLERLYVLLTNPINVVKQNIREKGESLAVAIYGADGSFLMGVRQSTYQDPEVHETIQRALQERERALRREKLKNSWQVRIMFGDYYYVLKNKLLPYNIFEELRKTEDIYYLTKEELEDITEDDDFPPTDIWVGWNITEEGKKKLRLLAIQSITNEQLQVLTDLIKKSQEESEQFRKQAWLVQHANEIARELDEMFKNAQKIPETDYRPEGEKIQDPIDPENIYGGGQWWVIEKHKNRILFVINNGADGDDWSLNNIRTGGAGAIGVYIPYTKQVEDLLLELQELEHKLDPSALQTDAVFQIYSGHKTFYKPQIETALG